MGHVFQNKIKLTAEQFEPLVGCWLVDVSEGAAEDGTEVITMEFVHPMMHKTIRASFAENGDVSISEFEDQ